jgi:predicted GIY-YIG superfamily endonuclease
VPLLRGDEMKAAVFFAFLILLFPATSFAQTTATPWEKSIGVTGCTNYGASADFDTIAQCTSTGGTSGTMQKAPLFVGTVTSPPYAATTCDSNKAGMIQYTGSAFQGCDGSAWTALGSSGVCVGPSSISYTNQTGVAINTQITSNAVTMSGFSCAAQAVCSNCVIIKNTANVGASTTVSAGDTIAIRVTSSPNYGTTVTATLYVGTTNSGVWSVTTTGASSDSCDTTTTAGTVCADGSVYAGISPDNNSRMFTTRCDYGQTWDTGTSACVNGRVSLVWAAYNTVTGYTSSITGRTNSAGLAALGAGYSAALACENLTVNGKDDWYLPAKDELNILVSNATAIGHFLTDGNWYKSSTEADYNVSWIQRFSDSGQYQSPKTDTAYVRCVRHGDPPDTCGTSTIGGTCSDGTIYAGMTPDGNTKMFATPCDAGQTGSQGNCTGTRVNLKWSYGGSITTGITNSSTGRSNTASLSALNGNADGPYEAATYCENLSAYGHTDWYLPAAGELTVLYVNNAAIGGFSLGPYDFHWSSTELYITSALRRYMLYNYMDYTNKYDSGQVRCVRR